MGKWDLDAAFAAMRERYEGWLAQHGADSSRAVGWVDPAMQALRFDLLAQVMEGEQPVTVADFGCGTGALFAHLTARPEPPPLGGYIGYDLVPAMVEAARTLHTDPRARFEVGTAVSEEVDYVIASGAFSVRGEVSDADWEAHVKGVLQEGSGSTRAAGSASTSSPAAPRRSSPPCTPGTRRPGRAGARARSRAHSSRCATARRCRTSRCSCAAVASVPPMLATTLYDVVLWVHITAVVIAFGALFAYPVFLAVVAKAPIAQRATFHHAQIAFSKRVTGPTSA